MLPNIVAQNAEYNKLAFCLWISKKVVCLQLIDSHLMHTNFPALVSRLLELTEVAEVVEAEQLDWGLSGELAGALCWPPEMLSIHGTVVATRTSQTQRDHLAFQELRNFFSLSIHGERALVKSLERMLAENSEGPIADYIDVIRREEVRHMSWFQTFCNQFADGPFLDRLVPFPNDKEDPTTDVVVFCQAMIFEALLDFFNSLMAKDERLHPLVREIHRLHHGEESRHLAFDRGIIQHWMANLDCRFDANRMQQERSEIADHLAGFVDFLFGALCSKDAYRAAGLENPHQVRREALSKGPTRIFHERALEAPLAFLRSQGLYSVA
ncbi:MAG: hypothetical protein COA70_11990 [Planctomycetota bacterium]|nr:MAG: hypothetical protein COA70_11990 [Planctomycetota bacterium]